MRERIRQIGMALTSWSRRWWWAALLVLAVLGGIALGIILSQHIADQAAPLIEQAAQITEPDKRVAAQKDLLQYKTDNQIKIWTTIAQVAGAIVLGVGGYFAWRNLRVAQEVQITNRFTQAIGQLGAELKDGSPNLEVRLGGIYALERIARDSPRDHWTIMEILTAYVRQNARWTVSTSQSPEEANTEARKFLDPPPLRTDIQATLTVLGRRIRSDDRPEPGQLDLSKTYLGGAILNDGHFERANLSNCNLEGAHLQHTHLEGAFMISKLDGADLRGAYLDGAFMLGASLFMVQLEDASLEGTSPHLRSSGVSWSCSFFTSPLVGAPGRGTCEIRTVL